MEKVFLVGGMRSHIGLTGGIFKNLPAEELAASVLKKLAEKYSCVLTADGLFCGNAVGAGGNIARLAALKAGFSERIPALTIDMQCASAAASIELAMAKIGSGLADILVAGGFESTSMQPVRMYAKTDSRYTEEGFTVAQFSPDTTSPRAMLEGAERTCQKHGFTREELDAFVVRSHRLAKQAREEERLREVIVSVSGSTADEGIRDRMSPRLAARMPKLFTEKEVAALLDADTDLATQPPSAGKLRGITPLLTAANACLTNDGAAFVILASEKAVKKYGLQAEAELLAGCEFGVDPRYSPEGAVETGVRLLHQCDLQPEQIDAFEYNEAFAVISALFARKYPALTERYCPWGGALAYGHPYGASGAILLLHLWQELKQENGSLGMLSIAGAGGLGTALLIRNCNVK